MCRPGVERPRNLSGIPGLCTRSAGLAPGCARPSSTKAAGFGSTALRHAEGGPPKGEMQGYDAKILNPSREAAWFSRASKHTKPMLEGSSSAEASAAAS